MAHPRQLTSAAPPVEGFDDCYTSQWRPMLRLATGLLGDAASAEDATQDAFAALYRRWHAVHPDARVGYLRTSVVNGTRTMLRRLQTARKHQGSLADRHLPGADEHVNDAVDRQEVWRALDTLPQRQREVVVLRYLGELSDAEIAAATGLSLGGVRSSSSRGLSALRTVMGEIQ